MHTKKRPSMDLPQFPATPIRLLLSFLLLFCQTSSSTLSRLSTAYKNLLDDESLCKHRRVVIYSDKPLYKPGETANFSAYFFHLLNKHPASKCKSNISDSITIYDVNDKSIASLQSDIRKTQVNLPEYEADDYSVVFFSFEIPKDLPGGVFSAKINKPNSDKVAFFIMNRPRMNVALLADWSADFVKPGDLLRGKLTFKAITADKSALEPAKISYRWTDGQGTNILSWSEPMILFHSLVTFKVPPFETNLIFTAEANSGAYSTIYKREFRLPSYTDITIDFTIGTGRVVKDMTNKIYFQAFATGKRDTPVEITSARVISTSRGKTSVIVPSLSSDSLGKGMFDLPIFASDFQHNSLFELEVTYESGTSLKYQIIDFSKVQASPVKLAYKALYYRPGDTLSLSLETHEFIGKVSVVIQNKSSILSRCNRTFKPRKKKTGLQKRNVAIRLSKLNIKQGGVFTVQLYSEEQSPIEQNRKTIQEFTINIDKSSDDQPDVLKTHYNPPNNSKLSAELLQEIDIFIEPKRIIGASLSFGKGTYLPGDSVEYKITPVKNCKRCSSATKKNLKAIVLVTDESAFLEIEKSRSQSSLWTKLFLEREATPSTRVLPSAFKYIDHIFDPQSHLTIDERSKRERNVEFLLGNSKERKFIFALEKLEQIVKGRIRDQSSEVSHFYDYLIPKVSRKYYTEKMRYFHKRLSTNNIPKSDTDIQYTQGAVLETARPTKENQEHENSTQSEDNSSENNSQEPDLKKDTIHYEFKLQNVDGFKGHFTLPERVTNFIVRAFLFNSEGVYGYTEKSVAVRKPINIFADIPLFIYKDEEFVIPVHIENNTSKSTDIEFAKPNSVKKTIKPQTTLTELFKIGAANLPMQVVINDSSQQLLASYKIAPQLVNPGIYMTDGISDILDLAVKGSSLVFKHKTKELISGNNSLKACLHGGLVPILMTKIQEFNTIPRGCFEQASATTFPIITALKILKRLSQTPDLQKLTSELTLNLNKGITLLLSYECRTGGFDWFGRDPGHTTLTAYGLWQFYEIAQIDKELISPDLISRVESFLNDRRDKKGGFELPRGICAMGNPEKLVSDIYTLMVLSQHHQDFKSAFSAEINHLVSLYMDFKAKKQHLDSYKLALIGLVFLNIDKRELVVDILHILDNNQKATGEIGNAEPSITRSGGLSLSIETTAFVMFLALKAEDSQFKNLILGCYKFIVSNLKGTHFISTQASILSLLAIDKYIEKIGGFENQSLTFDIFVNDSKVDQLVADKDTQLINSQCVDLSKSLSRIERKHQDLKVTIQPSENSPNKGQHLFQVTYKYYSHWPESNPKSPLTFAMTKNTASKTDTYTFSLGNKAATEQGMAVIEFNRPSCYDFNINDLEVMRSKGDVDYYEVLHDGKTLVFYFRGLKAHETKSLSLSLVKRFAESSCKDRASSAYLYYDKDGSLLYRKVNSSV
jgi:hypothetical protein